jgi:menaquinone-dependent protoporphyrinogen oxidase
MAPHVLVATASRHGSTLDIGDEIGRILAHRGITVTDLSVDEVDSVAGYDAVLLGSAVYAGHWLTEAVDFVNRHAADLAQRPVWLYSSGPVGDPPMPQEPSGDIAGVVAQSKARGHRLFAGRLDPERLGLGERLIVRVLRAPKGDFRDWPAIDEWANAVADELLTDDLPADNLPTDARHTAELPPADARRA